MMMRKHLLLLAAISMGVAPFSRAAAVKSGKKSAAPVDGAISATVALPDPSQIPSERERMDKLRLGELRMEEPRMEISISTWMPSGLEMESLIPASRFEAGRMPDTRLLVSQSLGAGYGGNWSLKLGGDIQSLTRQGTLGTGGLGIEYSENLYWAGAHAGIEWQPLALETELLSPYAGVALIPSLLITQTSVFGDGKLVPALPFEAELGVGVALSSGRKSRSAMLQLGALAKGARINGATASGLGFVAGLRFSL